MEVAPALAFRSDKALVKIILENLVENAVKFHDWSERVTTFVKISAVADQNSILISVVDNGIGIGKGSRERVFELFVRASERSESGGIGLYLSKLACTKLEGNIKYTTTSEGYTEFAVRFPIDLLTAMEKNKANSSTEEITQQKSLKTT